jgi:hypothetical protein
LEVVQVQAEHGRAALQVVQVRVLLLFHVEVVPHVQVVLPNLCAQHLPQVADHHLQEQLEHHGHRVEWEVHHGQLVVEERHGQLVVEERHARLRVEVVRAELHGPRVELHGHAR